MENRKEYILEETKMMEAINETKKQVYEKILESLREPQVDDLPFDPLPSPPQLYPECSEDLLAQAKLYLFVTKHPFVIVDIHGRYVFVLYKEDMPLVGKICFITKTFSLERDQVQKKYTYSLMRKQTEVLSLQAVKFACELWGSHDTGLAFSHEEQKEMAKKLLDKNETVLRYHNLPMDIADRDQEFSLDLFPY